MNPHLPFLAPATPGMGSASRAHLEHQPPFWFDSLRTPEGRAHYLSITEEVCQACLLNSIQAPGEPLKGLGLGFGGGWGAGSSSW